MKALATLGGFSLFFVSIFPTSAAAWEHVPPVSEPVGLLFLGAASLLIARRVRRTT